MIRLESQHVLHEVFELWTQWLLVDLGVVMDAPKNVELVCHDEVVEGVRLRRLLEGLATRVQNEEEHAEGEHVGALRLVADVADELRGHVVASAKALLTEAIACLATDVAGHCEINQFEVELGVEHQVLQLDVAMAHTCTVHRADHLDQLLGVKLEDWRGQTARIPQVAEKLTVMCQFI